MFQRQGAGYPIENPTTQQKNTSRPASGVRKVAKAWSLTQKFMSYYLLHQFWVRVKHSIWRKDAWIWRNAFSVVHFLQNWQFFFSGRTSCLKKTFMKQIQRWQFLPFQSHKKPWRLSFPRKGWLWGSIGRYMWNCIYWTAVFEAWYWPSKGPLKCSFLTPSGLLRRRHLCHRGSKAMLSPSFGCVWEWDMIHQSH